MIDQKIYVLIKNEGTKVWRPMLSNRLGENIYKIKEIQEDDFDDEDLEFLPGQIVICEMQLKSVENVLFAIKSIIS